MIVISRVRRRRELAATAALALAGAGFVAAFAAPAQAASACAVTYQVTNAWPGGFLADVTVTNQGAAASPTWVLTWTWASGQTVVGGWNATFSQAGTSVTATGSGALASGASAAFGFQANTSGSATVPTSFALDGQTCGTAAATSTTSTSGAGSTSTKSTKTTKTKKTKTKKTKTKKTKTTKTTTTSTTSTTSTTTTTSSTTTTTTTTTTKPPTTTTSTGPTGPSTTFPTAAGNVNVTATISVSASFDGGMKRYSGLGDGGQSESQPAIFSLADGATLKNVIIGTPAGDGIHCLGTCTLTNVWWEDVGEDAATFKGTKSTQVMTVDGGGARYAADKVFQHNGPGTFVIKNFFVDDFGKLYRACGNCSSSYQRNVVIDNVIARAPGYAIAGINTNFGDTARITRLTILNDSSHKIHVCAKYKGVPKGSEPTYIGDGPDGSNCLYSTSDVSYR